MGDPQIENHPLAFVKDIDKQGEVFVSCLDSNLHPLKLKKIWNKSKLFHETFIKRLKNKRKFIDCLPSGKSTLPADDEAENTDLCPCGAFLDLPLCDYSLCRSDDKAQVSLSVNFRDPPPPEFTKSDKPDKIEDTCKYFLPDTTTWASSGSSDPSPPDPSPPDPSPPDSSFSSSRSPKSCCKWFLRILFLCLMVGLAQCIIIVVVVCLRFPILNTNRCPLSTLKESGSFSSILSSQDNISTNLHGPIDPNITYPLAVWVSDAEQIFTRKRKIDRKSASFLEPVDLPRNRITYNEVVATFLEYPDTVVEPACNGACSLAVWVDFEEAMKPKVGFVLQNYDFLEPRQSPQNRVSHKEVIVRFLWYPKIDFPVAIRSPDKMLLLLPAFLCKLRPLPVYPRYSDKTTHYQSSRHSCTAFVSFSVTWDILEIFRNWTHKCERLYYCKVSYLGDLTSDASLQTLAKSLSHSVPLIYKQDHPTTVEDLKSDSIMQKSDLQTSYSSRPWIASFNRLVRIVLLFFTQFVPASGIMPDSPNLPADNLIWIVLCLAVIALVAILLVGEYLLENYTVSSDDCYSGPTEKEKLNDSPPKEFTGTTLELASEYSEEPDSKVTAQCNSVETNSEPDYTSLLSFESPDEESIDSEINPPEGKTDSSEISPPDSLEDQVDFGTQSSSEFAGSSAMLNAVKPPGNTASKDIYTAPEEVVEAPLKDESLSNTPPACYNSVTTMTDVSNCSRVEFTTPLNKKNNTGVLAEVEISLPPSHLDSQKPKEPKRRVENDTPPGLIHPLAPFSSKNTGKQLGQNPTPASMLSISDGSGSSSSSSSESVNVHKHVFNQSKETLSTNDTGSGTVASSSSNIDTPEVFAAEANAPSPTCTGEHALQEGIQEHTKERSNPAKPHHNDSSDSDSVNLQKNRQEPPLPFDQLYNDRISTKDYEAPVRKKPSEGIKQVPTAAVERPGHTSPYKDRNSSSDTEASICKKQPGGLAQATKHVPAALVERPSPYKDRNSSSDTEASICKKKPGGRTQATKHTTSVKRPGYTSSYNGFTKDYDAPVPKKHGGCVQDTELLSAAASLSPGHTPSPNDVEAPVRKKPSRATQATKHVPTAVSERPGHTPSPNDVEAPVRKKPSRATLATKHVPTGVGERPGHTPPYNEEGGGGEPIDGIAAVPNGNDVQHTSSVCLQEDQDGQPVVGVGNKEWELVEPDNVLHGDAHAGHNVDSQTDADAGVSHNLNDGGNYSSFNGLAGPSLSLGEEELKESEESDDDDEPEAGDTILCTFISQTVC